jgi:hypothetical protein
VKEDVAHEGQSAHDPDAGAGDDGEGLQRIRREEVEPEEDAHAADGHAREMEEECHEGDSRFERNDRTDRRGRLVVSELETDAARPRSVQ